MTPFDATSTCSQTGITRRFANASMALVAVALLVVMAFLSVFQYLSLRQNLLEDSLVEARVLADTLSAALLFEDEQTASELIAGLRLSPAIRQAGVFNHQHTLIAAYRQRTDKPSPTFPTYLLDQGERVGSQHLEVLTPIRHQQRNIGYLYIEKSLDPLYARLGLYLLVSLSIIAAAMGTAAIVVNRARRQILKSEERLQTQANFDAVTGLENRHAFNLRLHRGIELADAAGSQLAIAVLDLDNFKAVNDALGHHAGDELLRQVGRRLRSAAGPSAIVCRLGGDEFAIIFNNTDEGELGAAGQRIVDASADPYFIEGREFFVTNSVGIALYPQHAEDVETLVRCADTAMYHAKESGKNHWVLFSDSMNQGLQRRIALENSLRKAVDRQEMELHFQPQFATGSATLIGAEALLRWNSPELGNISPAEFIPLAEANGSIVAIGEWVLHAALDEARAWQSVHAAPLRVAVNVSARQLEEDNFPALLHQALTTSGLPGNLLEIELTESVLMSNVHRQSQLLDQIKEYGVQIAIDDFGTGYSSMAYLRRLPIDRLKVDRAFVKDLPEQPNDRAIVAAMVALAHSLDLEVIAEGVETEAQRDILGQLQVDHLQGYLLGRPMSASAFRNLLVELSRTA